MKSERKKSMSNRFTKLIAQCLFLMFIGLGWQAGNAFGQFDPCGKELSKEQAAPHNANCLAAYYAFEAAGPLVIGQRISDGIRNNWIIGLYQNLEYRQKFNDGLKLVGAMDWAKAEIAKNYPISAQFRVIAINNAFREVYGRDPNPTEQATYDAKIKTQQAWYATIVNDQRDRLKENAFAKQGVIARAYKAVFGREPSYAESQYWQARSEHYRLIREANRNWLYSPNGAKDLVETVTRALRVNNGKSPNDDEIKSAMAKFSNERKIYEEMIKPK
jgi:hypothetical protein